MSRGENAVSDFLGRVISAEQVEETKQHPSASVPDLLGNTDGRVAGG
jgi:hypothetical protein